MWSSARRRARAARPDATRARSSSPPASSERGSTLNAYGRIRPEHHCRRRALSQVTLCHLADQPRASRTSLAPSALSQVTLCRLGRARPSRVQRRSATTLRRSDAGQVTPRAARTLCRLRASDTVSPVGIVRTAGAPGPLLLERPPDGSSCFSSPKCLVRSVLERAGSKPPLQNRPRDARELV